MAQNPGTNEKLGPGPGLIIPSPAGILARFDVVGWNQTTGQGQWSNNEGQYNPPTIVASHVGNVNVSGVGDHTLTNLSVGGFQGTLDVVFTTGTAGGAPQHVVALADQIPTPVAYIAILLDTSNRPYAVVTDVAGTLIAQSTAAGPVLPAGITLEAKLTWNARTAAVSFTVGETSYAFGTAPSAPWTSFAPSWLMVGDGFGTNLAFAGTVGNAQTGNGI